MYFKILYQKSKVDLFLEKFDGRVTLLSVCNVTSFTEPSGSKLAKAL